MSTIALLAALQDGAGLSLLGSIEMKAVDLLETLLGGGPMAAHFPLAIAAFLVDESSVVAAIDAGIVTANKEWAGIARKPQNPESHWRPRLHPEIPPAVILALALAEQARGYWIAKSADIENCAFKLEMVRSAATEWAANDPSAAPGTDRLVAMIAEAQVQVQVKPGEPEWLISVSIDVGGSTEAKTRLKQLNATPDRQKEYLRIFYKQFLLREMRFYDQLTKPGQARSFSPIDLAQIFYVKGIGDEVWLLIEPKAFDREHLLHLLAVLVEAAQGALANPIFQAETAKEEGAFFDAAKSEEAAASGFVDLHLPLKVFIDKVDGAYSISQDRADIFLPWINGAVADGRTAYGDLAMIANRIGAGTGTLTAGIWRNAVRTDFIGHEIDRLFRAAKAAKPLLVTIGQNMMHAVDPGIASWAADSSGEWYQMVQIDPGNPGGLRRFSSPVGVELIPAEAKIMKGIDEDYRVYHFFDLPTLRGQFAMVPQIRRLNAERARAAGTEKPKSPQFVRDMRALKRFMKKLGVDAAPGTKRFPGRNRRAADL